MGERTPYKPLLILYELGKLHLNNSRFLPYEEVKQDFKELQ